MMSEIRPIDANALIKELSSELEHDYDIYSSWYQKCERDAKFEFCIDRIKEAPMINPDDLRPQGRWHYTTMGGIVSLNGYCCSLCHEQFFCKPYNYCPNCGAKMDGKENEDA